MKKKEQKKKGTKNNNYDLASMQFSYIFFLFSQCKKKENYIFSSSSSSSSSTFSTFFSVFSLFSLEVFCCFFAIFITKKKMKIKYVSFCVGCFFFIL